MIQSRTTKRKLDQVGIRVMRSLYPGVPRPRVLSKAKVQGEDGEEGVEEAGVDVVQTTMAMLLELGPHPASKATRLDICAAVAVRGGPGGGRVRTRGGRKIAETYPRPTPRLVMLQRTWSKLLTAGRIMHPPAVAGGQGAARGASRTGPHRRTAQN